MNSCLVCLKGSLRPYHPACSRQLFGIEKAPSSSLTQAKLETAGLAMLGRTSLSGAQMKISVSLSVDRHTLQVLNGDSFYILKPASPHFPDLPANEHVSMLLAMNFKIKSPSFGLIKMQDDSLAYIIKRFDRTLNGKLKMEDFCQLLQIHPENKYSGGLEQSAKVLEKYSATRVLDRLTLFQQFVFSYWIGNADAHWKNFSLLQLNATTHSVSPVYDQLSTMIYPKLSKQMALTLGGKRTNIRSKDWLKLSALLLIPPRAASDVLHRPSAMLGLALPLVDRSYMSDNLKIAFKKRLLHTANEIKS